MRKRNHLTTRYIYFGVLCQELRSSGTLPSKSTIIIIDLKPGSYKLRCYPSGLFHIIYATDTRDSRSWPVASSAPRGVFGEGLREFRRNEGGRGGDPESA